MSAEYYTLVTDIGHAKLTNALALGQVVTLTHFAVGDGNGAVYNPVAAQTALAREVYRAPINAIRPDDVNPTWLTVEAVIPASVGGWTVREAGIFDVDGDLIAIAKYPESVKPALDSGVGKDLYCRVILQHGNVSTVTLKIDPAVVLATRAFVTDTVAAGIADHAASVTAHPDASTTVKGFVELATPTETKAGTDTVRAVTPKGLADTLGDLTTAPHFDATKRVATTEFVQRALGNLRGLASANASAALTLAEVGKLFAFYGSAANQTLTLPDLRTLAAGAGYHIVNQASVPVRIAAAGGQAINVNTLAGVAPAAAMEIGPGDAICITSNASTANPLWNVLGIARNDAFRASLASAGYQVLPSGLILQWVQVTSNVTGPKSFSWPIAFPSAVLGAVATHYWGANGATTAITPAIASVTLAGATINETDATSGHNFSIFAIGV